jgi:hypothetical protein
MFGQFALLFGEVFAATYDDIDATFAWCVACEALPVAAPTATAVPAASALAADIAATSFIGDISDTSFHRVSKQTHLRRS